jgi:hypothetical protein
MSEIDYATKYFDATGRNLEADVAVCFKDQYDLAQAMTATGYDENLSLIAFHAGLVDRDWYLAVDDANRSGYDVVEWLNGLQRTREMPLVEANIIDIDEEN